MNMFVIFIQENSPTDVNQAPPVHVHTVLRRTLYTGFSGTETFLTASISDENVKALYT